FIGSVLVPLLQEHGYDVTVVDLLWFRNNLPAGTDVQVRNLFELDDSDLAGFDQVIFLAGLSNDPMAEYSPAKNFIENGALPSYLAFVAKKAGVKRFVHASSCSIYGYSINELSDEESPVTCAYPYGISKLQGERGVLQLQDAGFSTIALRQGTVCGYSPRSRFDLIVNTMYKTAMTDRQITVNNPSIWRPILDVRDTAYAFLRAVQADLGISGAFNVAYDNFTVGQIADLVKDEVEELTGEKVGMNVKNISDFRNYKVTSEKAKTYLGYSPKFGVTQMVADLHKHRDEYGDFSNFLFYNIDTFKRIEASHRAGVK
ncbi:MAG: SDR family oxidoreductase, partial [Candidatus Hydrogenedentes bacterium]|nr:SDR family oxidoreductase [Candidatus Hydrogenedentota bacterium]